MYFLVDVSKYIEWAAFTKSFEKAKMVGTQNITSFLNLHSIQWQGISWSHSFLCVYFSGNANFRSRT